MFFKLDRPLACKGFIVAVVALRQSQHLFEVRETLWSTLIDNKAKP